MRNKREIRKYFEINENEGRKINSKWMEDHKNARRQHRQ